MPIYSIQGPDGRIFDIEGPEGATEQQLLAVARAEYLRRPAQSKEDTTGFRAAASAGFSRLGGEAALTAGKIGLLSTEEAERIYKAQEKKAKERFTPTQEGWLEAPLTKLAETAGGSLPYMLGPIAAGAAAATAPVSGALGIGALTAGALGAGAVSAGQFTGSNIAAQMEEGKTLEETSGLRAVAAAIPQAALDTAAALVLPGIGKLLGRTGARVTEDMATSMAKQAFSRKVLDYAVATGKGATAEGITEATQQVLERLQASKELADPDAQAEYIENFLGGAALATVLGPFGRAAERSGIYAEGRQRQKEREAATRAQRGAADALQRRLDIAQAEEAAAMGPHVGPEIGPAAWLKDFNAEQAGPPEWARGFIGPEMGPPTEAKLAEVGPRAEGSPLARELAGLEAEYDQVWSAQQNETDPAKLQQLAQMGVQYEQQIAALRKELEIGGAPLTYEEQSAKYEKQVRAAQRALDVAKERRDPQGLQRALRRLEKLQATPPTPDTYQMTDEERAEQQALQEQAARDLAAPEKARAEAEAARQADTRMQQELEGLQRVSTYGPTLNVAGVARQARQAELDRVAAGVPPYMEQGLLFEPGQTQRVNPPMPGTEPRILNQLLDAASDLPDVRDGTGPVSDLVRGIERSFSALAKTAPTQEGQITADVRQDAIDLLRGLVETNGDLEAVDTATLRRVSDAVAAIDQARLSETEQTQAWTNIPMQNLPLTPAQRTALEDMARTSGTETAVPGSAKETGVDLKLRRGVEEFGTTPALVPTGEVRTAQQLTLGRKFGAPAKAFNNFNEFNTYLAGDALAELRKVRIGPDVLETMSRLDKMLPVMDGKVAELEAEIARLNAIEERIGTGSLVDRSKTDALLETGRQRVVNIGKQIANMLGKTQLAYLESGQKLENARSRADALRGEIGESQAALAQRRAELQSMDSDYDVGSPSEAVLKRYEAADAALQEQLSRLKRSFGGLAAARKRAEAALDAASKSQGVTGLTDFMARVKQDMVKAEQDFAKREAARAEQASALAAKVAPVEAEAARVAQQTAELRERARQRAEGRGLPTVPDTRTEQRRQTEAEQAALERAEEPISRIGQPIPRTVVEFEGRKRTLEGITEQQERTEAARGIGEGDIPYKAGRAAMQARLEAVDKSVQDRTARIADLTDAINNIAQFDPKPFYNARDKRLKNPKAIENANARIRTAQLNKMLEERAQLQQEVKRDLGIQRKLRETREEKAAREERTRRAVAGTPMSADFEPILQTQTKKRMAAPLQRATTVAPQFRTGVEERTAASTGLGKSTRPKQAQPAIGQRAISKKDIKEANKAADQLTGKKASERLAEQEAKAAAEDKKRLAKQAREKAALLRQQAKALKDLEDYANNRDAFDSGDDTYAREQGYASRTTQALPDAVVNELEHGDAPTIFSTLADTASTDFNRKLAARLAEMTDGVTVTVKDKVEVDGNPSEGAYDAKNQVVELSKDSLTEEALLHEGTHAATVEALDAYEKEKATAGGMQMSRREFLKGAVATVGSMQLPKIPLSTTLEERVRLFEATRNALDAWMGAVNKLLPAAARDDFYLGSDFVLEAAGKRNKAIAKFFNAIEQGAIVDEYDYDAYVESIAKDPKNLEDMVRIAADARDRVMSVFGNDLKKDKPAPTLTAAQRAAAKDLDGIFQQLRKVAGVTNEVIDADVSASAKRKAPAFYSALLRTVEDAAANSAPVNGWKALLKGAVNKGQIKQAEIEWSGVNDWLDLQKGRLSKERLLEYLRNNGVRIEEVVRDSTNRNNRNKVVQFSDAVLPGGTNYREVLLTLPPNAKQKPLVEQEAAAFKAYLRTLGTGNTKEMVRLNAEVQRLRKAQAMHRSEHWTQPNVLVHLRVNDRIVDGKKVLFVEEIQSDWGQDAREGLTVPSGPFIHSTASWLNLALKRAITMAAEGGYDRLAFIDGEQTYLRFPEKADGTSSEKAFKTFYDQMVPQALQELAKKLGGTVSTKDGATLSITPAMREQVSGGLPLFSQKRTAEAASLADEYGLTNLKEFASEVMSNSDFRKRIDATQGLLRRIYNAFLRLLGFDPKTLSEQAVENVYQLFAPSTAMPQAQRVASIMRGVFPSTTPQFSVDVPPEVRTAMDAIVARRAGFGERVKAATSGLLLRTRALDRWASVEELIKRGLKGNQLTEAQALQARINMRMLEQRSQLLGTAIVDGVPQLKTDETGIHLIEGREGANLRKIFDALKEADVGDARAAEEMFTAWMAALRAEQEGVGVNKLNFDLDPAEVASIKQYVSNTPKIANAFEKARRLYKEYNTDLLQLLVDTGVMDRAKMRELLAGDYVPYYRVENGVVRLELSSSKTFNIGNLIDQPQLRELVGGNEKILPFFEGAMQNTAILMRMATNNMQTRETAFVLKELGLGQIRDGEGEANTPRFKRDGEWKHIVLDPDVFPKDIPASLVLEGLQGIKTATPALVKLMGMPANFLRKWITRAPIYPVRQVIRDSAHAWLTTGGDFTPVLSSIGSFGKMVAKRSDTEQVLQRAGVISSNIYTGDTTEYKRFLKEMRAGDTTMGVGLAKLDAIAQQGDAATRAVLYDMFRQKGMSHPEALLSTLESMNFSRRGTSASLQWLSTMIPFFHAQIQGLDAVYRAFKGDTAWEAKMNARSTMIKRGLLLSMGTMAYALMMQDDEAYKNATPDQRLMNWFVRIPGLEEPVRIPIPFELGLIFKSVPETIINTAFGDTKAKDAVKALGQQVMRSMPGGDVPLPTAIKPVLEVMMNTNLFSDAPIESARERGMDAAARYRTNTTEIAKLLGQAGVFSPVQIEHLVRGYMGNLPLHFMALTNVLLRPSVSGAVERPDRALSEMPIIGSMFQPNTARGVIDAAYKEIEGFQQAQGTYKKLLEDGDIKGAQEYANRFAYRMALNSTGGAFRQQMGEFAEYKRMIAASNLSGEEKRRQIDSIKRLEIQYAKQMREVFSSAE